MRALPLAFVCLLGLSAQAHAAFVQIDSNGNAVALFAGPQPDIAGVQQVPDDDPRVSALQQRLKQVAAGQSSTTEVQRLIGVLVQKGVLTKADEAAMLGQ